jgi:hypothetical protein
MTGKLAGQARFSGQRRKVSSSSKWLEIRAQVAKVDPLLQRRLEQRNGFVRCELRRSSAPGLPRKNARL